MTRHQAGYAGCGWATAARARPGTSAGSAARAHTPHALRGFGNSLPDQEADYDWFKVAQAEGFEIPENLVVERHPFDGIAEYIRAKRPAFGAIVVDAGGGSTRIFHEAGTEANLLLVLVAPTKIERRNLVATFDEAERATARNIPRRRMRHRVVDARCRSGTSEALNPLPGTRTRSHEANSRSPCRGRRPCLCIACE